MAGTITNSGLISGIDTASIVDQLVSLESRPISLLKSQQSAIKSQVSALGDIVSKLSALETAAKSLGSDGVLAAKATSTNDAFTATPGQGALAGRYSVRVDQLARAAKWRSGAFASADAAVAGGDLTLTIGTDSYKIAVTAGTSLADVAFQIRQSGAPVSAQVLTGKDGAYLSITTRDTGYTGTDPKAALDIGWAASGAGGGQEPGLAEVEAAQNALFTIDGLDFERKTNTVTDAIGGVTLTLKKGATAPATTGTVEDLVLTTDSDATRTKLQKFVDAYNGVMSLVQRQLAVTKDTDRKTTLAGDSAIRALQHSLQGLLVTEVPGLPNVRTLADVGVKTNRDGSLTIDSTSFASALARDPSAIDTLFSKPTTGLAQVISDFVQGQIKTTTGVLSARQTGLNKKVTALDDQMAVMQRRVAAFRTNLEKQFSAMESTLSNIKSTGQYLNAQLASLSGGYGG
jgi:flagellar hook-associated protein 2